MLKSPLARTLVSSAVPLFLATSAFAAVKTGAEAPNFTLKGNDGKTYSLADFKGKTVMLEWYNKDCPYVEKHYGTGNMQKLQTDAAAKGVVWLTIISSAPGKQGHLKAAEATQVRTQTNTKSLVTLHDEDGKVGKMFSAKTTPHMYVINASGTLTYQGAIDDKPTTDKADIASAKTYAASALEATLAGKPVDPASTKPYGCSVKY
jgi:peroxiredoxin